MRSRWALLLAACLLLSCGSDEEPSKPSASWRTGDGFVRDPAGRAVIMRGVNLAGAHKVKPYLGSHQPPDYVRLSEDWGLDSIRFLVIWAAIEPNKGEYDAAYLDAVAERMDWAQQAGLSVILDMHQDVYGEGFGGDGAPRWTCDESHYAKFTPTTPWFLNYLDPEVIACVDAFWQSEELRSHYIEAWRRLAQRIAKHPAVIGFDPMNEPFWGSWSTSSFDIDVLEPFYEQVTKAVRAEAPHLIAFIEPFSGKNLGFRTSLQPFPLPSYVYSPHAYDSSAESGTGFDPNDRDAFLEKIDQLQTEASDLGAPLWIGEYGGPSNASGIEAYVDAGCDGADLHAAGSQYWAYDRDSDGYGLLDDFGNEKSNVVDILVRPYPMRVAGRPIDSAWNDTDRQLVFHYTPDPKIASPTEIALPPRVYPNGVNVSCDGCTTSVEPGRLLVTRPPRGEPATLTITP